MYKNRWFLACIALAVLLAISIFTGGFYTYPRPSTSGQLAADIASLYYNPSSSENKQPTNQKVRNGDYIFGSDDAQITIVEYGDYECPYCKIFHDTTLQHIKRNYIEKGVVKFIYRDFPLQKHPDAFKAAEASECAGEQGKFWEMNNKLFENQGNLSIETLKNLSVELGLDTEDFNNCLESDRYSIEVTNDIIRGQREGATSTPTFFINGQKIIGAQTFKIFSQVIDAIIQNKTSPFETGGRATRVEDIPRTQVSTDDDPMLGNSSALITIVEFTDYQCSYCAEMNRYVVQLIKRDYVNKGKAKFVIRDYPLDMHKYAKKAAEAAECAHEQGKFWEMNDKMFANQEHLEVDDLKHYAANISLDTEKFNACLDSGKYAEEVEKDKEEGQNYGVGSTPTIFINGIIIVGQHPYSKFKQIIEDELLRLTEKNGKV